jgi:hypothetical protein
MVTGSREAPMEPESAPSPLRQSLMAPSQWEEVEKLRAELSRLRQQVETLLKFAALVTREVRDGMDVDGGYVQTIATEAGLFIPEVVTAPCREYPGCACAGYGEWPMTCYRDSPELLAARSGEGGNNNADG